MHISAESYLPTLIPFKNEDFYNLLVGLHKDKKYTELSTIMNTYKIKRITCERDNKEFRYEFINLNNGLIQVKQFDYYGIIKSSNIKNGELLFSEAFHDKYNGVIKRCGLYVRLIDNTVINASKCNKNNYNDVFNQIKYLIYEQPQCYIQNIIELMQFNDIQKLEFYTDDNLDDYKIELHDLELTITKYLNTRKIYEQVYENNELKYNVEYKQNNNKNIITTNSLLNCNNIDNKLKNKSSSRSSNKKRNIKTTRNNKLNIKRKSLNNEIYEPLSKRTRSSNTPTTTNNL